MATLSITIPDAIAGRVTADICYGMGYSQQIEDPDNPGQMITNPVTPGQFVKNVVKEYLIQICRLYEAQKAAEDARIAALGAVDTDIVLGD